MTDRVDLTDLKWHIDPSDSQPIEFIDLKTKATLDLFGTGLMVINYQDVKYFPNRWIRFWSKVFFNSKWTLMDDNERNNQEVRM